MINTRAAFSLIGMLVTLACIVVLFVILSRSMQVATTGGGQTLPNSLSSANDREILRRLYEMMAASANDFGGRFISPSRLTNKGDVTLDTTANLFSAMVMNNYVDPLKLVSKTERNPYVIEMEDYDWNVYNPEGGVLWDPRFQADLKVKSNVSFGHLPLFGERAKKNWEPFGSSSYPVFGSRGPRNGIADPNSYTGDVGGRWAGHMVFGDGHVDFLESFTTGGLAIKGGQADNIFAMDEDERGGDAIITFTRTMYEDGPEIQHD
jgi:hypothetical protein